MTRAAPISADTKRRGLGAAALVLAAAAAGVHLSTLHQVPGPAGDGETARTSSGSATADPVDTAALVEGGLAALVASQNADGSFGPRADARVGTSAVACLALLADGNTERRGRHHEATTRAIRYLMSCSIDRGELTGYIAANGDTVSRMHGHGYATLALTQAYGMYGVGRKHASTSGDLRRTVAAAVDVIVRSQSRAGGWFYEPFDEINDEGSITVCIVQALRAARNCGFAVPKATIDRALRYVRTSQNEDGSFRYRLVGNERTSFELTAAACATLAYGGRYFGSAVRNARDFLWNRRLDAFLEHEAQYPYYGLYYAVLALWYDYDEPRRLRRFDEVFPRIAAWYAARWNPATRTYEHADLRPHREMEYGAVYRTAFATLTLQIPHRTLPIFER